MKDTEAAKLNLQVEVMCWRQQQGQLQFGGPMQMKLKPLVQKKKKVGEIANKYSKI